MFSFLTFTPLVDYEPEVSGFDHYPSHVIGETMRKWNCLPGNSVDASSAT